MGETLITRINLVRNVMYGVEIQLPGFSTASSQAFSVNAFRRRIRVTRNASAARNSEA